MDEKIHKTTYGGFSIVSVAPLRANQIDSSVISKIKSLQLIEIQNCQGLSTDSTGKAGRSLHGKPYTSPYLLKYYEKSKYALDKLSSEHDYRPSLIKFSAVKDSRIKPDETLSYRMFQSDIKLVKTILENAGFVQTENHDWNILWIGHNPKSNFYEKISLFKKISHFPNSFEITRKDRLCSAIMHMQELFGKEPFNFTPETYNLPEDFSLLYSDFNKEKKRMWIVKPTCSSQGRGIYLIDSISEVPVDEVCIISRYISNPLLINSLKFDLRIYVVVTCYEPLRIYIYEEGLARFASEAYRPGQKNNRFMHLTNYSVNKRSENFIQNEDFRIDDSGHKWSMSAVMKLLDSHGINTEILWKNIYELIIKAILSCEATVLETSKKLGLHRTNCFDLLGFDVLVDSNLKPWLLEVNLSPSMATDSPLDMYIKSNLLADMFNLVGVRAFDKKKDFSARNKSFSKNYSRKNGPSRSQSPPSLKKDSPSSRFKEILKETLEEQERRGHFIRIYPAKGTNLYDQYFSTSRAINQYLYRALFVEMMQESESSPNSILKVRPVTCSVEPSLLCPPISPLKIQQKRPTSIESPVKNTLPELVIVDELKNRCRTCKDSLMSCAQCRLLKISREEKIIITGDDMLMEYITRLAQVLKNSNEGLLKFVWRQKICNFIAHPAWITPDTEQKLWKRINNRLQEMKERRRKLLSVLKRKKILAEDTEKEDSINSVLRRFTSTDLEEILRVSSRNTALEVIKCLIDDDIGLLSDMLGLRVKDERPVIDSPSFEETEFEKQMFVTQNHRETLRNKFFSNKQPVRKRIIGKKIQS